MFELRSIFGILVFTLIFGTLVQAEDRALEEELKRYQKILEKTEKLAKDKTIKFRMKALAKIVEQSRKIVKNSNLQAVQKNLLEIQKELRSFGEVESADFQKNIQTSIHTMIPMLVRAGSYGSEIEKNAAFVTARFVTPEGRISLTFPADVVAGETISGFGIYDPPGLRELYALHVLRDSKISLETPQKWDVPADVTSIPLILRDDAGSEILSTDLPVAEKPPDRAKPEPLQLPEGVTEVPFPGDIVTDIEITSLFFQLSTTTAAGGMLEITGPFDGDFTTTTVQVAEEPLPVVVESARKVIVRAPADRTGRMELSIREKDIKATCFIRNVKAVFWMDKELLQPGEAMEVSGRIEGLNWLKKPFELKMITSTPSVISIESPALTVNPADVTEAGTIEFKRKVTGLKAEPFAFSIAIDPAAVVGPCESPN